MYLFCYLDGDGMQLLPAGAVGESDHEVIVAGIHVGRNRNVDSGSIAARSGGNLEVLIIDPGIHCFVMMLVIVVIIAFHRSR